MAEDFHEQIYWKQFQDSDMELLPKIWVSALNPYASITGSKSRFRYTVIRRSSTVPSPFLPHWWFAHYRMVLRLNKWGQWFCGEMIEQVQLKQRSLICRLVIQIPSVIFHVFVGCLPPQLCTGEVYQLAILPVDSVCPIRCLKRWYLLQVLWFFLVPWVHRDLYIYSGKPEDVRDIFPQYLPWWIVYHMDTFGVRNFKLENCLDGCRKTFEYFTRRGTTLW